MNDVVKRLLVLVILVGGLVAGNISSLGMMGQEVAARSAATSSLSSPALLTVAFLDVGQGDAIFIETPDGVQILIDGGPSNTVLRELGRQMPILDRDIDLLVATHPDKDHIGGLVDVLGRYEIKNILLTDNQNDTTVSDAFDYMVGLEESIVKRAVAGQVIEIGKEVSLVVLSPLGEVSDLESNTSSIVVKLTYGEVSFMLTGDAPLSIENYLVDTYGTQLESEVLKLGHHGSRTSTADSFLKAVDPDYAVVSAGKDNRYGHPNSEVVEKVEKAEVEILSTVESGTIVFESDGKEVWLKK
ncbi:MAG: ComEC/Rec2 family competence protein [Candidatus Paceibacterota bacterium]